RPRGRGRGGPAPCDGGVRRAGSALGGRTRGDGAADGHGVHALHGHRRTPGETPVPVRVGRTGYTGERGYEIFVPWDRAEEVVGPVRRAVESEGGRLAGLGARDTLRTEMAYPLHGHELSERISPLEARCGWAVAWDKPGFRGHEALRRMRATGPPRR